MATLADNAAGYATLSLLPPGSRVLAVEFKLSFIRPAVGQAIRARGKVRKLGKTIALCEIEVETSRHRKWVSCAWGSETVYCDIAKSQNQRGPSSQLRFCLPKTFEKCLLQPEPSDSLGEV